MNKKHLAAIAICIIGIITIAIVIMAGNLPVSQPEAKKWVTEVYWEADRFNFSGWRIQTDYFNISENQWSVSWEAYDRILDDGHFDIKIYDTAGNLVEEIVTVANPEMGSDDPLWWAHGTKIFNNLEGTFRVDASFQYLSDWKITVKEYR